MWQKAISAVGGGGGMQEFNYTGTVPYGTTLDVGVPYSTGRYVIMAFCTTANGQSWLGTLDNGVKTTLQDASLHPIQMASGNLGLTHTTSSIGGYSFDIYICY